MPWDPMQDFQFMWANSQAFMSLFRAMKPVICKAHGHSVAGGSDIALCADLTVMGDTAQIGYMPTRVWGCPTTAMWVHRLGPEKAKWMMYTGDKISGVEAAKMGLVLKSVPDERADLRWCIQCGCDLDNDAKLSATYCSPSCREHARKKRRRSGVYPGHMRKGPQLSGDRLNIRELAFRRHEAFYLCHGKTIDQASKVCNRWR